MNLALEMQLPVLNLAALAPLLIVFTGAVLGTLVEAFVPQRHRHPAQVSFTVVAVLAALVFAIIRFTKQDFKLAASNAISVDGPGVMTWILLLGFGLLSLLLFAERGLFHGATSFTPMAFATPGSADEAQAARLGWEHTEVYPVALFSLTGMMMFAVSNDFVMLFVALEVMSLPLYLLAGMARRRRLLSQESALKYFLLGSLSSALMLFGIALVYGFTGSFNFRDIAVSLVPQGAPGQQGWALLLAGLALIAIGMLFKIGAVPFHSWVPDVYHGSPTPVTAFMAACTKIAAVAALLRVFYVAFGGARWDWQPLIAVIAVLTVVVGSILAVTQTDMKRLLAYSSVAHAGFILTAFCGASVGQGTSSVSAILFYLVAYGLGTLGAFAIVMCVRKEGGEATGLSDWSGMGRKNPLFAIAMSVFLLSFAGIPLTAGFIGKVAVFLAAWRGGYWWLVVVAVVMSVVGAYFYLRIIITMFAGEPAEDVTVDTPGMHAWVPIIIGLIGTIALGLLPQVLLDVVNKAAVFLF